MGSFGKIFSSFFRGSDNRSAGISDSAQSGLGSHADPHDPHSTDLSKLTPPTSTRIERERAALRQEYQSLLELLDKEESDRFLKRLPVTHVVGRELKAFDTRVQTALDEDGRPSRSQTHQQVGAALFRALHQESPHELVTVRDRQREERVAAHEVVSWLCSQAIENLVSHNVLAPVRKLTPLTPPAQDQSTGVESEEVLPDHENDFSLFVVAATLQAAPYRPWALDTLLKTLQNSAAEYGETQIHIGAKNDLYLLGAAIDVKYKDPAISDQVHQLLATFLPEEHVEMFIREYKKHFLDTDER